MGDNLIEAEAFDRAGASAMDEGFVHRTAPYAPPEISINEPAQGDSFLCGGVMLQGSFDPGSSEADRFQASMKAEGETVSFPVSYSAAQGEFWSGAGGAQEPLNIYFRPDWGNNRETAITLTVSLITTDGDKVEDTVEFIYACWW